MDDSLAQILLNIPVATVAWLGITTLILLMLSAAISGSEVAFFSLSQQQLEECEKSSKSSEIRIIKLRENPKLLLATILIVNNLVNVAIVTVSTYMAWLVLGKENKYIDYILLFGATSIIVFFGEILPKVFATQRNLSFARLTSGLLFVSTNLLSPFSMVLTRFGDALERRLQKNNAHQGKYQVTVKELGEAVEMTTKTGSSSEEKEILKSIVNFGTKTVKQIMRSRMDITAFGLDTDFHQLMDRVNKCGFSRIPIYNETIDKIEGVLYIKDLLPHIENDEHFSWQYLIRKDTYLVPENKKIDYLLRDFQQKRVHIAIVIDEYGGTSGLVTMEDIIEEIVGEINDEFDNDELNYRKLDEQAFLFDAKTSLNDLSKILEVSSDYFDEVKGESESLGGLMLELFGKLPNSGERVSYRRFIFIITSVNLKRIKSVRVRLKDGQNLLKPSAK